MVFMNACTCTTITHSFPFVFVSFWQMLKTLSLFNSPKERYCSRLVQQNEPSQYHHDMWLQGQVQVKTFI